MKEQLVTKKILKWYDLNKRSLPWRKNVSLQKRQYYTLVSEFMLQQTQVVTVIPYFNRFVNNLPSIKFLANVKEKKNVTNSKYHKKINAVKNEKIKKSLLELSKVFEKK